MSPHYHLLHHVHIMNYTPSPNVVTSSPSVVTPSVSVVSLFHADQNQESDTGYATNDNNNVSWVDGPVGSQDLDTGVMVLHKLLAGLTIFLVTFVGGVGPALVQKLCRGTHQRRRLQGLKGYEL